MFFGNIYVHIRYDVTTNFLYIHPPLKINKEKKKINNDFANKNFTFLKQS